MSEKLQKVLARVGFGSRRQMEEKIKQGLVSVNGKIASVGDRVDFNDKIRFEGRLVKPNHMNLLRTRVIAYYKPEGQICSRNDPDHSDSVFDYLPRITQSRWVMVGRLDLNTSGLLLFTNDGELANRLMHPSYEIQREYAVRVLGEVDDQAIKKLKEGILLEDGMAKFTSVVEAGGDGANHWYRVTLAEGRSREVRRLWEALDIKVSRLIRVAYGPYKMMRNLSTGNWLELEINEVNDLRKAVGLDPCQVNKIILRHNVATRRNRVKATMKRRR